MTIAILKIKGNLRAISQ